MPGLAYWSGRKAGPPKGGELRLVIPVDSAVYRIFSVTSPYRFIPGFGSLQEALLQKPRGPDPAIAPDIDEFLHRSLMHNHRGAWSTVASVLASQDALRPGLTDQEAGDLAAALTRIEIYRILSSELSWSHERITEELTTVVRSALLG